MNKTKTAEAAYALFDEFRAAYAAEWERLAKCERLYYGDHWQGFPKRMPASRDLLRLCCIPRWRTCGQT